MKKTLLIVIVFLVLLVTFGCSLGAKTYSLTGGGICIEITTTDKDVKNAAEQLGYSQEPCSDTGVLGVCANYATVGGTSADAYFYDSLYTDAASAQAACELLDGTWTSN